MFTIAYISTALTSYLDFVGRRQTMDDRQVADTATLIFDEYPKLKMDDIALFFRFCKISKFGKLYDLNGAVLLDWMRQYSIDRSVAEYKLHERLKEEAKAAEEERRRKEWEALTPEQQAAQNREIAAIQQRIYQKLTGKVLKQ